MTYLLDTNVCIMFLNQPSAVIANRLQQEHVDDITVCSVVKSELFYGAMKSQWPERTLQKQLAFLQIFKSWGFDDQSAIKYGQIRADLARKGTPIGPYDLQIAAIALANDCTLVTHNTGEFSRIAGLRLEDWAL